MKVDIWSDIACPFCYVGKRQFEIALGKFEHRNEVEVVYHSFQLDPQAPVETQETMYEMLAKKYGRDIEQSKAMNERMFSNASEFDVTFNFDDVKLTNTFDAHRLIHLGLKHSKQAQMKERIQKAYFTEGLNVGKHDVLEKLATDVGLDPSETTQMLESDLYSKEVQDDIAKAKELGISGVPFFVFNNEIGVSGAQGVENLLSALQQARG